MIKLAISGCQGRMGLSIMHLAQENPQFKIHSLLERKNHPAIGGRAEGIEITADPKKLKGAQVLIEFTSPESTLAHLEECVKQRVKMVIGTTGLSEEQIIKIEKASHKIPIVFSYNMSIGVNVLFDITRKVAQKLGGSCEVRISEAHHVHKKDAPSGTAKTLAAIIEKASEKKVADIKSIRENEIVGDHEITFETAVDTITLKHHAKTRDIFAHGALQAAVFLAGKKKGLFTMQDVLDL